LEEAEAMDQLKEVLQAKGLHQEVMEAEKEVLAVQADTDKVEATDQLKEVLLAKDLHQEVMEAEKEVLAVQADTDKAEAMEAAKEDHQDQVMEVQKEVLVAKAQAVVKEDLQDQVMDHPLAEVDLESQVLQDIVELTKSNNTYNYFFIFILNSIIILKI
jgi:hypothetical protein